MKKKKKLIIIACIALVAVASAAAAYFYFFNGSEKEPTLEETINNRISAYETDLTDSMEAMTSQSSVSRYLVNWAENKGIDVKTDASGNVIYSIKATEGLESKSPSVILCGYDYTNMEYYKNSIACALTVAKNDLPHGEYKVIFVSEESGTKTAADGLSDKYFTSDTNVFCLSDISSSRIALSTGGLSKHVLSKDLSYMPSAYDTAYKVSISGLPSASFTADNADIPNPIKILGDLLANFKSTSILFELADFSGGSNSNYLTPNEAYITIVVNKDAASKLEKSLEKAIEKFYDKYSDDYPEAQYTFEATDAPSKVISTEDTESIVSLMYTAINGIHYKDDNGEVASIASIGFISTENNSLVIEICASSYDDELTEEISNAYQTISALTDVTYRYKESSAPFHASAKGELLADEFWEAYSDYQNINLDKVNMAHWTPAGSVSSKGEAVSVIALGVTKRTKDNFAGGLIKYLEAPAEE